MAEPSESGEAVGVGGVEKEERNMAAGDASDEKEDEKSSLVGDEGAVANSAAMRSKSGFPMYLWRALSGDMRFPVISSSYESITKEIPGAPREEGPSRGFALVRGRNG
jgi:hypothetical protein